MVEGKDFFDGDTKLGVKNIPADAVDKVQVLRNYNENSVLKGVENNQESVAMNIKLKDGKKNFWFGDVTAGIGVGHAEERYVVNPKLFYYSPKYSLNVITNFNNIGELPLTFQDYFKFSGGFKNMMSKGGSNFNVSSNDLGISLLRNDRAKEIETNFGAANFSYNPTKSLTLSGFAILSSSITDLETKTQTDYLYPNSSDIASTENKNDVAHQKNNFGLFKFSSSYKPNTNFQLDYDVLSKLSNQVEDNSLLRETVESSTTTSENIYTAKKQKPVSVNQNLGMYYTVSEKNVFAFEMQHLYQNEDPFYNANLQTQPFNLIGYISDQNRNDITQKRFVQTNKIDTKLDYYYMLTPKSNINITLGNTYSHQNFDSSIYQILDDQSVNNLTDVTTPSPTDGQVLVFRGSEWIAETSAAGGDLTGDYPNPTINLLQGKPVQADAPNPNDMLVWNGTAWTPQPQTSTTPAAKPQLILPLATITRIGERVLGNSVSIFYEIWFNVEAPGNLVEIQGEKLDGVTFFEEVKKTPNLPPTAKETFLVSIKPNSEITLVKNLRNVFQFSLDRDAERTYMRFRFNLSKIGVTVDGGEPVPLEKYAADSSINFSGYPQEKRGFATIFVRGSVNRG